MDARFHWIAWAAMAAAASAFGDTVTMVDGLKVEGTVHREVPGFVIVLVEKDGATGSVKIPRSRIMRIEYDITAERARLSPEDYLGHFNLARRALQRQLYKDAIELFEYAIGGVTRGKAEAEGILPEAHRLLGLAFEYNDENAKALSAYQNYKLAKPDDAEIQKKIDELAKKVAPVAGPTVPPPAKIVEGYEAAGWGIRNWGFPGTLTVSQDKVTGNQYLAVQGQPSDKDLQKTAFGRTLPAPGLDLSKQGRLTFRAYNGGKKSLHFAVFFINSTNDQYESRQIAIRPGDWQSYEFRLDDKSFKSNKNNWAEHNMALGGRECIKEVIFMIYHGPKEPPLLSMDDVFFRQ